MSKDDTKKANPMANKTKGKESCLWEGVAAVLDIWEGSPIDLALADIG